jgi:hypothetical protein
MAFSPIGQAVGGHPPGAWPGSLPSHLRDDRSGAFTACRGGSPRPGGSESGGGSRQSNSGSECGSSPYHESSPPASSAGRPLWMPTRDRSASDQRGNSSAPATRPFERSGSALASLASSGHVQMPVPLLRPPPPATADTPGAAPAAGHGSGHGSPAGQRAIAGASSGASGVGGGAGAPGGSSSGRRKARPGERQRRNSTPALFFTGTPLSPNIREVDEERMAPTSPARGPTAGDHPPPLAPVPVPAPAPAPAAADSKSVGWR